MTEQDYQHALHEIPRLAARSARPGEDPLAFSRRCGELEHQLTVDYVLGIDFPEDRRRELLAVHRRMVAARDALIAELQAQRMTPHEYAARFQAVADEMVRGYERLLSADELDAFLGLQPGEPPPQLIEADQVTFGT